MLAAAERLSGGHGADSVIITAATKDSAPIELAAAVARDRATVTAVGDVGLSVPRAPFYEKELQLRVSRSYGPGRYDPQYEEEGHDYPIGYVRWTERRLISYFFEEVTAGRLRLQELVTHELPIDRAGRPTRRSAKAPAWPPSCDTTGLRGRRASDGQRSRRDPHKDACVGIIGPGLFARSKLLPELAKLGVLRREVGEQILSDGGHEERSTSHHEQVLQDLTDVAELLERTEAAIPDWLSDAGRGCLDGPPRCEGPTGGSRC